MIMRNRKADNWKVTQVAETFPGAKDVLQNRGISANAGQTLAAAASGSSVATDDVRAVLDYRLRRAARVAANQPRETELV